jgi:hypothetical protein
MNKINFRIKRNGYPDYVGPKASFFQSGSRSLQFFNGLPRILFNLTAVEFDAGVSIDLGLFFKEFRQNWSEHLH